MFTTSEIIDCYNWTESEIATLEALGIDKIYQIFADLDDDTFDRLDYWFNAWLMGITPKARLNYWLKKTGITLEMLNIYFTL
jgi:hypothetical protein